MVDINPAEWDMARKAGRQLEEMSELDRVVCGADQAKHLVIPMCDVYNLRRIAGILNGLAASLEVSSRRTTVPARTIILEVRAAVDEANSEIRRMTGKGKTRKPYRDRLE